MKASKIVGAYSFVPLHVTAFIHDTQLGTATAFTYLTDGTVYLITNWHVVSGLHAQTGNVLHTTKGVPNRLVIMFYKKAELGRWTSLSLTLYQNRTPVWLEHPTLGRRVDVVALPVRIPESATCNPANEQSDDSFDLLPGQDVFILGFPEGFSGGGRLPIWKRGSLATEPDVDVNGLPKFLVDTATRRGMSGAPVIAQVAGMWMPSGSSSMNDAIFGRAGQRFIGVYSSREGDDETKVQMGVVWKASVIDEIVHGATVGPNPHPGNEFLFAPL